MPAVPISSGRLEQNGRMVTSNSVGEKALAALRRARRSLKSLRLVAGFTNQIWLLPAERRPQMGSRYDSFVVTGKPGREHLLAIASEEPLGLEWLPCDPSRGLSLH